MYMAYNRGPGIPLFCGCRSHGRYVQGRPLFAAYSYERVQCPGQEYYDSTPYRIAVTQEGPAGPLFRGTRAHTPLYEYGRRTRSTWESRDPFVPLSVRTESYRVRVRSLRLGGPTLGPPGVGRQGPGRRRLPNCQRGGCVPLFFSSFGLGHTEDRQGWRVPLLEGKGLSWLIGTGTLDAPGALGTHWQ